MFGGRVAGADADGRWALREPPASLAGDADAMIGEHLICVVGVKESMPCIIFKSASQPPAQAESPNGIVTNWTGRQGRKTDQPFLSLPQAPSLSLDPHSQYFRIKWF